MNLINRLTQWFIYGSSIFFAAGAVADVGGGGGGATTSAGDGGGASTSTGGDGGATTTTEPAATTTTPTETTTTAPASLSDIVKKAAENAEKALAKPGTTTETAPATETKPAETKSAAETKPAETTTPAANPLDKIGPLPAEKIVAAFKDIPAETQAILKEKGLDVETLSANARMAAEGLQYKEICPTVDALQEAMTGAKNFWKIDQGLAEVKDVDGFDKLMMSLAEMTYIRDEQGNPIPDPAIPGAFKNNGSLAKMVDFSANVRDSKIEELADLMAEKATSEEGKSYAADLKGAIQFIQQFVKSGYQQPGAETDLKSLPAEVQERLKRADELEKSLSTRDAQQSAKDFDATEDSIIGDTHKSIAPIIEQALSKTALSDRLKTSIAKQVWDAVVENMNKNELYGHQRDTLSRRVADYQQRRVALNLNYLKPVVAKALEEIVGEIGKPIVDANAARHDKIDTQNANARMEPKTSGTTVQSQPGLASAEDVSKKALELARQSNPGAQLGDRDYFAAVMKLKKLPISA